MNTTKTQALSTASFIWSIAEILRGDFKQSEYGKVVLPFVVMRRLDCILEASKAPVPDASDRVRAHRARFAGAQHRAGQP